MNSSALIRPLALTICTLLAATPLALAKEPRPAKSQPKEQPDAKPKAVRPPDETVKVGLAYLLKQQHQDGGWGQGGGWRQAAQGNGGRVEGPNTTDPSDLGNTCLSLVALLRAGQTPTTGEQKENAARAFAYICQTVEGADADSLYVTPVRDTQLQVKIGTYVDTFLAGWALSELKGNAGDEAAEKRRAAALDKVVAKIEKHQKEDGTFQNNNGWAAVLSQGLCSKALNLASSKGARVSAKALDKDQQQNLAGLDMARGDFTTAATSPTAPSTAGVAIYNDAAKLGGLNSKVASNAARIAEAKKVLEDKTASGAAVGEANAQLKQFDADDQAARVAQKAVAGKLADERYVAGFGNNGGEEYLSYMNLGEGLRASGGPAWETWKAKMEQTICGAQNDDGSWAGQHCITGRTFCTSAALLTLMIDKGAPIAIKTAAK